MIIEYPKISIITTALNEEKYIEECINSLLNQSYKGEIEILFVDGGSEDNTLQIVEQLKEKHSNISVLKNNERYQASGRNIGISSANTKYIAYLDAHSRAAPDWLKSLYDGFVDIKAKDNRIAGIGSVFLNAHESKFAEAAHIAFNSIISGCASSSFQKRKDIEKVDNAYACLYDKEILDNTGYYNASLQSGEDIELNQRLTYLYGYNLYVNPNAKTYYYRKGKLKELFSQQFKYGFWRLIVNRYFFKSRHAHVYRDEAVQIKKKSKFPKKIFIKPLIPAIFLISLFILLPLIFGLWGTVSVFIFITILASYFSILLINSIYYSIKSKKVLLILFPIYLAIHFGYGSGTLAGLFSLKHDRNK